MRHARFLSTVVAAGLALTLLGCSQGTTPPPTDAEQPAPQASASDSLFTEVTDAQYSGWATAPNYDARQPAKGPHGDEVQIFLSPEAEQALASGAAKWPVGAIIVKDVYGNGALVQIAAGKKTADGWYWGEWDTQGTPVVEGLEVEPCQGCHTANDTDGTLAVKLK